MKTRLLFAFLLLFFTGSLFAQVTKLSNNKDFEDFAIVLKNQAFLVTDKDSIWVTDGTNAGTQQFVNNVSWDDDGGAIIYKNKIYFAGKTSAKGSELWVSDGTASGTKLFKDINAGSASSSPTNFFVFNNKLFFFAKTVANGNEFWKSDGTASGTVMVKDILPGKTGSLDNNHIASYFPVGSTLYFQANDSVHGYELWKTNGNASGTKLVKDINAGKPSSTITTQNSLNGKLIFSAKDNDPLGIKIWETDGTPGGTKVIKKLLPNDNCSSVNALSLSKYSTKLVFGLTGFIFKIPNLIFVNQVYATDGTNAGTDLLKDLNPESLSFTFGTLAPTLNNKFYFTSYSAAGSKLWESDATKAGTKVTKVIGTSLNINSGHFPIIVTDFFGSNPDSIGTSNYNGKLFIAADDGVHGYEPWITDGTKGGTKLVKDIYQNAGSSISLDNLSYIYSSKGLYFAADDDIKGDELWLSNGTNGGTKIVADINPGSDGSDPKIIGILKQHILLNADDGDNNKGLTDLYKVNAKYNPASIAELPEDVAVNTAPDGSTFSVYPNPAKDRLNIALTKNVSSKHVYFVITNQNGQEVYQNEMDGAQLSTNYTIDISRFAQGTYYVQVRTDKGVVSSKFVKIQ